MIDHDWQERRACRFCRRHHGLCYQARFGICLVGQARIVGVECNPVALAKMERHRDMPAGGERLLRRAPGLHGTWVSGVRVFDGTDYVAHARGPGEVLTRFKSGRPHLAMPGSGS